MKELVLVLGMCRAFCLENKKTIKPINRSALFLEVKSYSNPDPSGQLDKEYNLFYRTNNIVLRDDMMISIS